MVILSLDVFGDEVHGARAVQGNPGDDVLQVLGPQLLHEPPHPPAFQLEHAVGLSGADGRQDLGIVVIDVVDIDMLIFGLFHESHRVRDHGQRPQAQKVHL